MPHIGWLINNRNMLIAVLEPRKSQSKAPADVASVRGPLPPDGLLLTAEVARDLSGVSFITCESCAYFLKLYLF